MITSSVPSNCARLRRGPQRTVLTSNGKARFAPTPMRLAVAITSCVMAALEAMQPSISITVTLIMSKNA